MAGCVPLLPLLWEQRESLLSDFTSLDHSHKHTKAQTWRTLLTLKKRHSSYHNPRIHASTNPFIYMLVTANQDQHETPSYLFRGKPPIISVSHDLRLSRATSAFCRVSPSGTLPGSDITAGEGAGLRAKGRAQGSLEQVVWVSYRIRRDWSFTKAWSLSKARWLSRQNLDEQTKQKTAISNERWCG